MNTLPRRPVPLYISTVLCCVCRSHAARPFTLAGCFRCDACEATFLDRARVPSLSEAKKVYDTHENDPNDARYKDFLSRLADPLLARLGPSKQGLDYGCGPGPALAQMLAARGHSVALYDPIYAPNTQALARTYDFVTCTEVIEHFVDPANDFAALAALVKPGGWLGIMTCFQTDDARFERWHYRRDPTHVVFYREHTLRTLATQHGFRCEIPVKDVALMLKEPT